MGAIKEIFIRLFVKESGELLIIQSGSYGQDKLYISIYNIVIGINRSYRWLKIFTCSFHFITSILKLVFLLKCVKLNQFTAH